MTHSDQLPNQDCHLQSKLGITERCSPACLYFERSVGCLFESTLPTVEMPSGVVRQLLRTARRSTS
jgi:hypothetical protein